MANKIITNIDSNLITLQYQELSDEAVIANELLVKQLIFILKSKEQMISSEDQKKINDYQILSEQLSQVLASLGLTTITEVKALVENQYQLVNLKNEQMQTQTEKFQAANNEYQKQIKQLVTLIKNRNDIIEKQTAKIKGQQSTMEAQSLKIQALENKISELETNNENLTKTGEKFKRKYEGQKNRKVVRFVDKVARR